MCVADVQTKGKGHMLMQSLCLLTRLTFYTSLFWLRLMMSELWDIDAVENLGRAGVENGTHVCDRHGCLATLVRLGSISACSVFIDLLNRGKRIFWHFIHEKLRPLALMTLFHIHIHLPSDPSLTIYLLGRGKNVWTSPMGCLMFSFLSKYTDGKSVIA